MALTSGAEWCSKATETRASFTVLRPVGTVSDWHGSLRRAHHWAREFEKFGHTVKLMAPQFVKPYVKTNKNDAADAEAICEAVDRPNMRFVPIKTGEQQAVLALHRARQSLVKARTAQANQMRGLLAEYGIVIPPGIHQIAQYLPAILEDGENDLPGYSVGCCCAWENI